MTDFPGSLIEFQQRFADEAACARYLIARRRPDGFVCPGCGGGKAWRLETKAWTYECASCGRQTSVTAGTIMHHSKLPLTQVTLGSAACRKTRVVISNLNTGNGGTSAILAWKIQPFLDGNGNGHCTGAFLNACLTLSDMTIVKGFCYNCNAGHNGGAYYGTIQPDPEGNFTMAFNFSNRQISPGIAYVSKQVSWPTPFHDGGVFLCQINASYTGDRDAHRCETTLARRPTG